MQRDHDCDHPSIRHRGILAKRHDNGGDFWATKDGRLYVGNPFSTLSSLLMLYELGVRVSHEAVRGGVALVWKASRDDGRIRLAPKAPLYPCYSAEAARVLGRFGFAPDQRFQRTIASLLESAHESGGWRCNFTKFGKGPETRCANPGATLYVLDALRFTEHVKGGGETDRAVESLLDHWDVRRPIGPCHYGIGSLFMQVEYPFLRYNLFFYVYVLSFYARARGDARFHDALATLQTKLDVSGNIVVERPHRGLGNLGFCARGRPSRLATARYREILKNL
ncbi:MAG TPA: hypothetical protein VGA22_06900 [Gemmatimonadales bacterium]